MAKDHIMSTKEIRINARKHRDQFNNWNRKAKTRVKNFLYETDEEEAREEDRRLFEAARFYEDNWGNWDPWGYSKPQYFVIEMDYEGHISIYEDMEGVGNHIIAKLDRPYERYLVYNVKADTAKEAVEKAYPHLLRLIQERRAYLEDELRKANYLLFNLKP